MDTGDPFEHDLEGLVTRGAIGESTLAVSDHPETISHYEEVDRLTKHNRPEFVGTAEIITRNLVTPPGVIVDGRRGLGVYAGWMVE